MVSGAESRGVRLTLTPVLYHHGIERVEPWHNHLQFNIADTRIVLCRRGEFERHSPSSPCSTQGLQSLADQLLIGGTMSCLQLGAANQATFRHRSAAISSGRTTSHREACVLDRHRKPIETRQLPGPPSHDRLLWAWLLPATHYSMVCHETAGLAFVAEPLSDQLRKAEEKNRKKCTMRLTTQGVALL